MINTFFSKGYNSSYYFLKINVVYRQSENKLTSEDLYKHTHTVDDNEWSLIDRNEDSGHAARTSR